MKVLYKWNNCFRFKPETDAFYLEVPKNEISKEILNLMICEKDSLTLNDKYYKEVNHFSKGNITHGLANENCAYFLIDKNVEKMILCNVFYPYSGQWGAYCPFEYLYKTDFDVDEYLKNAIVIKEINDLKNIEKIINKMSIMFCNVHNCKMVKKNIPILYGMPLPPLIGYLENKEIFFPSCDDKIIGGCEIENNSPKYLKKYYCKKCNLDREKWIKILEEFN